MRAPLLILIAAVAWACSCAPATGFTAAQGRAAADRAAAAWRAHQQADGAFVDYVSGAPTYGYANAMIGYGLLRAGVRAHDDALLESGFRAIGAGLGRDRARRGVFDTLAGATAYGFARRELRRDPRFVALRGRWEDYLRSIGPPFIGSAALRACTASPSCFHNHEAVGALGDLALAATGLRSSVPGAKLADPAALRASALEVLTEQVPAATGRAGRATGAPPATGLGLLSDTGTWPLAYHDFSTAMVAGAAARLGDALPVPTRAALDRGARTIAAFMAPDGDVAYLGRRQQQAWALAAAISTAEVARGLPGQEAGERAALAAVADRAFDRLRTVNRYGPGGLGAVPRPLSPETGFHGVDANEVVPAALTIFLLNLGSDAAAGGDAAGGAQLPADRDGSFLLPDQAGFATVRHGDLWYAVHRRPVSPDLRYDFGLVALKRRDASGEWRDVVRPRPDTRGPSQDSAGPVIVAHSVRYLPYGRSIALRPGGVVVVRGGYRSQDGDWLRRGVTFRFEPVEDGVAVSFPLEAGDAARFVTFLPAGEARRQGDDGVADAHSVASISLRPRDVRFGTGYASASDERLVAATMQLAPHRDQLVTYTVRARRQAAVAPARTAAGPARKLHRSRGGGTAVAVGGLAGLAVVGLAAVAAQRRRRRRAAR